ncbi:MAG: hypothetical protein WC488_02315 [Candidatus Micrarchaeia archaeon]
MNPVTQPYAKKSFSPLLLLPTYVVLPSISFYLCYLSSSRLSCHNSLSIDAFLNSSYFILFSVISLLEAALVISIYRKSKSNIKMQNSPRAADALILPFAMCDIPLILGFILSYLELNPWLIIPFQIFGLVLFFYLYLEENKDK